MALPVGFDRADGSVAGYGTAMPDDSVFVQSANGAETVAQVQIEEMGDSPQLERGEQATLTHRFTMGYERAVNEIQFLGRGTVRMDSYGFYWKVLSASIQRTGDKGMAILTVIEESISFDSPPDQFQIVPVELGVNIMKHPRYFYAFIGEGYGSATEMLNQHVIRILQDYFENTTTVYRDAITAMITASIGYKNNPATDTGEPYPDDYTDQWRQEKSGLVGLRGTDLAKYAALEIIQKFWRGEETPYVVGYQITWSQFYFRPPFLNPGGYVEDPVNASPQLPGYFWMNVDDPNIVSGTPFSTIYDWITTWNPQCYAQDGQPGGNLSISWLRKADEIDYERTWFKITRTWIGSPVGYWDADLYNGDARPTSWQNFMQMSPA